MSYPKAESISSLANYSKDIFNFSDSYLDAANMSYRTYSVAMEGQHGDAVSAFVEKLNTIQVQLFDQYPEALAQYAQTVATYEEALKGYGFNERMWSKFDGGATSLQTLYTGDQATEITNIVSNLNKLLQFSADAAGVDAPDLSGIQSTATESFSTAGTDRVTLATSVESDWSSFKENLANQTTSIEAFKAVINNATYLTQISPSDIAKRITSGDLPANHMYYLDGIQNKYDVKAVKLLMSEADYKNKDDFFAALGALGYADKLSDGTSDSIYGRVFEEMNHLDSDGHSSSIGYFTQSMTTNLTQEQASAYSKKMSEASARLAVSLKSQALAAIPEFPQPGSSKEDYRNYYDTMNSLSPYLTIINKQLEDASLLNNLFEYVYANELGIKGTASGGAVKEIIAIDKDTLVFENTHDTKSVTFKVLNGRIPTVEVSEEDKDGKLKTVDPFEESKKSASFFYGKFADVTITDRQTAGEINQDKAKARVAELRESQEEAKKNFIADLTVAATSEIPYVGPTAEITKQVLIDGDIDGVVLEKLSETVPGGQTVYNVSQVITEYADKTETVDKEIKNANEDVHSNLFDIGGSTYENGGKLNPHYNATYDLEGTLRQNDLEQNGLRSYYFRNSINYDDSLEEGDLYKAVKDVADYDSYISGNDPELGPPPVSGNQQKLLKGNSGLTISEDGGKNTISSQKVYDALEEMSHTGSSGFAYSDWTHSESKFYGNLVGSKTQSIGG